MLGGVVRWRVCEGVRWAWGGRVGELGVFFNDAAATGRYTLAVRDARASVQSAERRGRGGRGGGGGGGGRARGVRGCAERECGRRNACHEQ